MSFVPAVTTTTTKTMVNVVATITTTTQIDDLTWDRDETIWKEERTFDASHICIWNLTDVRHKTCVYNIQPLLPIGHDTVHTTPSMAPIKWNRKNRTTNRTNNYLCRFVVRQEKCCSSFKAVNPLRSSHSVCGVVIFFLL